MGDNETLIQTKVLFVDDEENILGSLRRLMMDEEFEVLTANSGEEALKVLNNVKDVGLIVSDQRMPGLAGADFLAQARVIAPEALRIMLTGYADINATIDAINKGGAYRYISKPWNDDEFLHTIRDGVQKYRLLQENRRLTEIVNRQNEELKEWNGRLKSRVLEQTALIRKQNEELRTLNENLSTNYNNAILAFSGLLELREQGARNHSRYVQELAVNAAKSMGLSGEEIETIKVAALLHDIGEIGIPEHILRMSVNDMDDEDLKVYRQHPVRGQTAIDVVEGLRAAGILIRHHHENFDGRGFPDRLKGDDIPLGARIIAMADFIDTTINRIGGENAIELTLDRVNGQLGKVLDPQLFSYFNKLTKYFYFEKPRHEMVEEEFDPLDLHVGLMLSRDIRSGTGVLLLSKGITLNTARINSIKRFYNLDPPDHGVYVLVER
ncbi:MAG: response regulator [Geobacteraceae bacterium]|nr:MAG: response regulator [Geobacteraceae bacterium]